jgi:hypothetical protein
MTDITASALVGMCGELFAYSDDKPYLFFNRLGESDYIFLFNLGDKKLKRHFLDNPLPNDSFLFFNFEVLDGDMEILKHIGQQRMPNGYQQLFDSLSLNEGDVLSGFVVGHDIITDFMEKLENL